MEKEKEKEKEIVIKEINDSPFFCRILKMSDTEYACDMVFEGKEYGRRGFESEDEAEKYLERALRNFKRDHYAGN